MRKRILTIAVVLGGLVVFTAAPAWSLTVSFFSNGNASAGFVNFTPAPPGATDTESIALSVTGDNGTDFDDFAGFDILGVSSTPPATPPKFDFRPTVSGSSGGAPRLVMIFSDGGNMQLRPLTWVANTWSTVDGATNSWDNSGGTCGFLFATTYNTGLACHTGFSVTDVFVVSDVGWLHPGGYINYIDNISYGGQLITGRPRCNGKLPTITGSGTILGTSGNDVIMGSDQPDTINGSGGNDSICSLGGNDLVNGGDGNDAIFGGDGNDTLNGAAGDDVVWGENGNDTLAGGAGTDKCDGGSGTDIGSANCEVKTSIP